MPFGCPKETWPHQAPLVGWRDTGVGSESRQHLRVRFIVQQLHHGGKQGKQARWVSAHFQARWTGNAR